MGGDPELGQAPRLLNASASARHYFGAELRRLRELRRLSQDQLGALVHFSGDTIRRVETADRFPRRELAQACDQVLNAGGALQRLWRLLDTGRPSGLSKSARNALAGSAGRDIEHSGVARGSDKSLYLSRIPFVPAVLDRAALDWLLGTNRLGVADQSRHPVNGYLDDGDLADVTTAMRVFRELDHAQGAGRVHSDVDGYIADHLSPLLARTPSSHEVGTRLHTLAAGFFELGGYQAVDIGADGVAQKRYLRALQLSEAAADRSYGAYLLAVNIGHLALHCNHPEPALRMARTAISGSPDASPSVQAALHSVVARAHARLGHQRECLDEILAAESQLARGDPSNEPAWIGYFTPAYLADELAHCFYDLGDQATAQRHVGEALASLQPSHTRRLAIDTALLASSLAAEGNIDEACAVGMTSVAQAAKTASHRCVQRVVSLRAQLELYRAEPEVREFLDYVHELLPAAA
jgi:transcriptional regulator with XRE-family HTH domain